MSDLTPATPAEEWVTLTNEDGSETNYLVDNVFEITYEGETNDYAVLIRESDLTGTGLVTPDIFRFDPIQDELTPLWDEAEKAFIVDYLMTQYEQPDAEKPLSLDPDGEA